VAEGASALASVETGIVAVGAGAFVGAGAAAAASTGGWGGGPPYTSAVVGLHAASAADRKAAVTTRRTGTVQKGHAAASTLT
jgi:hypothetical protein